jgi:hypothetical protein
MIWVREAVIVRVANVVDDRLRKPIERAGGYT